MLDTIYKSRVGQRLKTNPIAQKLRNSLLIRKIEQTAGDWRYPFILISWWLAGILVPRRRVTVNDVSFTLSCTNWITHFRWFDFKRKEPEVRYYIDKYVKNGDIFFDIGANVGVFSIYAAKRHTNISVYSFEPEHSNLSALKDNVVCNDLCKRVKIYSVGISNFVGFSRLHLQDLSTGSAAHTESRDSISLTDEGFKVVWSEGIFSVTLDYLCKELDVVPDAIKIDTDGNEDKILEGGAATLSNEKLRSLIIEIPNDDIKSQICHNKLKEAGFELSGYDTEKTRNEIWVRKGNKTGELPHE